MSVNRWSNGVQFQHRGQKLVTYKKLITLKIISNIMNTLDL